MTNFTRAVRTKGGVFPIMVRTTGEALDAIHTLSDATRQEALWHTAEEALFAAEENSSDADALRRGYEAFRDAVATKGWLNDIPTR